MTLSITKGTTTTWEYSSSVTIKAEAGAIFAKAGVDLNAGIKTSRGSTVTTTGTWTVPNTAREGWLEPGAVHGYTFSFKRYHYVSGCRMVIDKVGTVTAPTVRSSLKFKHS